MVSKGHKLIRSRQVAQQIVLAFGGLYFGTEDKQTGRYTEYGGTAGDWTVGAVDEKSGRPSTRPSTARSCSRCCIRGGPTRMARLLS